MQSIKMVGNRMNICVFCEEAIDDDALFCPFCGAKIDYARRSQSNSRFINQHSSNRQYNNNQLSYQANNQSYNTPYNSMANQSPYYGYKQRTALFTVVLVLSYFGVAMLAMVSFIIFLLAPPVGIIVFIIVGLMFWLTYALQQYNNSARMIFIVLAGLGILISIPTFNIISIAIGIFEIYVLAFDQQTVDLFVDNSGPNGYTDNNNYSNSHYYRNY